MIKKHAVILGAGISGLSLAWFLKRKYGNGIDLTIVEKSSRCGGWMRTFHKEGFLFEQGPHSCRAQGNNIAALKLVESLGLQDQVILPQSKSMSRYILNNQKLTPIPHNIFSMIFSPVTNGIMRAFWNDWRTPPGLSSDESVYAFISRRLSVEVADRLLDPLVSGIYAGDIRQLSIRACFPSLYEREQRFGSLTRSLFRSKIKSQGSSASSSPFIQKISGYGMFSFREGMETLPRTIEKQLIDSTILLECRATALQFHPHAIDVILSDGNVLKADHIFFALPVAAVADLVAPHLEDTAGLLRGISMASVSVVNLGYRKRHLKQNGFGFLVPSQENEEILGMIWDSCVFPQQNQQIEETRLTVMMGGMRYPEICQLGDDEQLKMALKAASKHLQIDVLPDASGVSVARDAIPQYTVGHIERVLAIKQGLHRLSPHLTCLGCAFDGVSVNDCIAQAELHAVLKK